MTYGATYCNEVLSSFLMPDDVAVRQTPLFLWGPTKQRRLQTFRPVTNQSPVTQGSFLDGEVRDAARGSTQGTWSKQPNQHTYARGGEETHKQTKNIRLGEALQTSPNERTAHRKRSQTETHEAGSMESEASQQEQTREKQEERIKRQDEGKATTKTNDAKQTKVARGAKRGNESQSRRR